MKPVPATDPNVKIPAAIKAAAARSDLLHSQVYAPPVDPNAPAEPEAPAVADPPVVADAPVTPPAPPAPPATPVEPPAVDWEHRYNSMKGRFERSQDEVRSLGDQFSQLQRSFDALKASTAVAAPAAPDAPAARLVTPEEEEAYGAELLGVVAKRAQEQFAPIVNGLNAKIADLEAQLTNVNGYVEGDSKQRMFDTLDARLTTWRETNKDPEFIRWLGLPDQYSGVIRMEMLKAAYERHDAPRVLAFFNGFLSQEAAGAPPAEQTTTPPPPAASPKVQLEELAAPGRARTAAPSSAPAEKPSFTRQQISKFYSDVRQGVFRGRDADRERLEQQIFDATREGRVLS